MPNEQEVKLTFGSSKHSPDIDAFDLDANNFQILENIEESGDSKVLTTRRGIKFFLAAPVEQDSSGFGDIYGLKVGSLQVPSDTAEQEAQVFNKQVILILSDDTTTSGSGSLNEAQWRGRFMIYDYGADSPKWNDLTTYSQLDLNGSFRSAFGNKLGSDDTPHGYQVQGYPIDGHVAGFAAMWMKYVLNSRDELSNHMYFGLGNLGPQTYPLLLQFINKPALVATAKRSTGYFADAKGFAGWYISKAAPTALEMARNFNISLAPRTADTTQQKELDQVVNSGVTIVSKEDRGIGGHWVTIDLRTTNQHGFARYDNVTIAELAGNGTNEAGGSPDWLSSLNGVYANVRAVPDLNTFRLVINAVVDGPLWINTAEGDTYTIIENPTNGLDPYALKLGGDGGEQPSVPPGSYIYTVRLELDGVNQTEPIWKGSEKIDGVGDSFNLSPRLSISTRSGVHDNDNVEPDQNGTYELESPSVSDDTPDAIFNTGTDHGLSVGSIVTMDYSEASYDGIALVTSIEDANSFKASFDGSSNIAYVADAAGTVTVRISNLQVGAWDTFLKRITSIIVDREFIKGEWTGGEVTTRDAVNNRYKEFQTTAPRQLAKIPINNTYYQRDTDKDLYQPNALTYTLYRGTAVVTDIITSNTRKVKLSDLLITESSEKWSFGIFEGAWIVFDYDDEGDGIESPVVLITAGLDSDQKITIANNSLAFAVDDTLNIRIIGQWVGNADPFFPPLYTDGAGAYSITVFDDQFEWAAGETGHIPEGEVMRPNWRGIALMGEQRFVWDYWEDARNLGQAFQTNKRSIRYTVPHEGKWPTVFFRGFLEAPGDENVDPIYAIVPTREIIANDTLRAEALILGKETALIMVVTNGEPIIQKDVYKNFGIAGPRAWVQDGSTVYGLNKYGVLWRFSPGEGFTHIGLDRQKDFSQYNETELSRCTMAINSLPNGDPLLWVECMSWDTGSETLPTPPVVFDKGCIWKRRTEANSDAPGDFLGDEGTNVCFPVVDGSIYQVPGSLSKDTTTPTALGHRYNLNTGGVSKRTSIDTDVNGAGQALNVENFQVTEMETNVDGSILMTGQAAAVSGAAVSNSPNLWQLNDSELFYDEVKDSVKRTFTNVFELGELDFGLGGQRARRMVKEIFLWMAGQTAKVVTLLLTEDTSGSTQTKTISSNAVRNRPKFRFMFDTFSLKISAQTETGQSTPFILRQLSIITKFFSRSR